MNYLFNLDIKIWWPQQEAEMPLGAPQTQGTTQRDGKCLFINFNMFRFKLKGLRVLHVNPFLFAIITLSGYELQRFQKVILQS